MAQLADIGTNEIPFYRYGRYDLTTSIQKNLLRALTSSVLIHFLVIGVYYLHQVISNEDELPVVSVRLTKYSELGPPPSIQNIEQAPAVGVAVEHAKPTIGIPVPVPDIEINPEQTIATQQELAQLQSPFVADDAAKGTIVVEQDLKIQEGIEPGMNEFVPVEKVPVVVREVRPEYPEFARRAGVEGTVWIKILVDKQGKPKKAVVVRSDNELLNESAMQAAMQWLFIPAVMNNGPVTVWVAIPFRFQLNKQS